MEQLVLSLVFIMLETNLRSRIERQLTNCIWTIRSSDWSILRL